MLRTRIIYGGEEYSVPGRDSASVQAEVDRALASGSRYWLHAVFGAGRGMAASLLITQSISIALVTESPDDTSELESTGQLNASLETE